MNKEKAPSDANKRLKGFGSGKTVHREAFTRTSRALNALQVKFDCGEGNERRTIIGMFTINEHIPEHKAQGCRQR